MFSKSERSSFKYWFAHWCAYNMTALNLGMWKPKYLWHDIEKPWLMMFYRDFQQMRKERYDGMIITGAPVETLDFEDVTYWDEMTEIFSWARTHVTSTLYICWAAQAGLYYHYGVPKYQLPKKMFGVFPQHTLLSKLPIFRGFDDVFQMPHSRHTEIHREDIEKQHELSLIAESPV